MVSHGTDQPLECKIRNENIMKILVTGGAGFIGSNLCEALLKRGDEVKCLDNFSTGKRENIQHLILEFPNTFQFMEGDIRNLDDCKKAVDGVEYVLHEAAIGSVPLAAGLGCGQIVLTVAVLSILITAPLGEFLIEHTYKKWLKKEQRAY